MVRDIMRDEDFLSQRAEAATEEDLAVAQDLLDTLAAHRDGCVGMAANMIGVNKRIIAFDREGAYMVMFNPEIIKKSGPYQAEEGCLSGAGSLSRYSTKTRNSSSASRPLPAGRRRLFSTKSTTARGS